jgi:DNA-binding MarR family transcriptional regulator
MTVAPDRELTGTLQELGRSFKGLMGAVRRLRGRDTHRPGELSFAQYSLLFGLADGGALSTRELAFAADISPATATQMLESLLADGLVERVRSETDKRVVLTSLTERGRALIADRRTTLELQWRQALAEFSDEELLTAAAVLDRMRSYIEAMESA